MARRTIIGKHALLQIAQGKKEIASQVFVYDQIREIRVDMEKLEVRVLMTYDEAYFRVFAANPNAEDKEKARESVLRFYNELVSASMKLTDDEKKHLAQQAKERAEAIKKAKSENTSKVEEVKAEEPKEVEKSEAEVVEEE